MAAVPPWRARHSDVGAGTMLASLPFPRGRLSREATVESLFQTRTVWSLEHSPLDRMTIAVGSPPQS